MVEKTRFGTLLKRYRQAAGLSQEALAERAGLSTRAISDLERGVNRTPRYATLDLLIKALSLSSPQCDLLKAAAQPTGSFPPDEDPGWPQPGLPSSPTRLVGREIERLQALNVLRNGQVRLLTLTGPSGVGKTRLALQLAQDLAPDFPDGIVYVPIASIRDASLVPGAIAQILKIRETPSTSTRQQVMVSLEDKQLLLVLDNLEQVLDCSPFLADLLASCPRLVILATSRSPLRLRAEQEHLLTPLTLDDAVALFCERAGKVQPGRAFSASEVAPICEQLDCLPLAIELAAMHVRLLPLTELRRRLAHRFALLRNGARDLPARQQTMEDAIAWSYDLLPPSQQRCFRALGLFVGGWTLDAAEAICWPEGEIASEDRLLTLAGLVEASLVQTEAATSGGVRFSMLELIREYALKCLEAAGEADLIQRRHAVYYARVAEVAEASFESGPATPSLTLAKELANVQGALQWAEASREAKLGLRLCGFARLWHMLGQPSQAERWFERMLVLDSWARANGLPVAPPMLRVKRLYGLGRLRLSRGKMVEAEAITQEALHQAEQISDENGMANAWATLGMIAQASGRLDHAEEAFNQSALHGDRAADPQLGYRAVVWQAELARARGELPRAEALLSEALTSAQTYESGWDTAVITTLLGHLAFQQQDIPLAKVRYRDGLNRLRVFGSPTYTAWCVEGCAAVLVAEGRAEASARLCAAAASLRQRAATPLPDGERTAFEQVVAKARELLGQSAFQQNWAVGAGYTLDEVIGIALAELD
jgi:predicted ATPase/transcriptional regulator with XRE-family HTH domain